MPGALQILTSQIKEQKGVRYRFVRLDSANVTDKKVRGYDFVRKEDPEIKGTILEKHVRADGLIAVGNLGLARISEKDAQRYDATIQERKDRRLRAIKRNYRTEEEKIKRKLGKHHKDFKIIIKEEDEEEE